MALTHKTHEHIYIYIVYIHKHTQIYYIYTHTLTVSRTHHNDGLDCGLLCRWLVDEGGVRRHEIRRFLCRCCLSY